MINACIHTYASTHTYINSHIHHNNYAQHVHQQELTNHKLIHQHHLVESHMPYTSSAIHNSASLKSRPQLINAIKTKQDTQSSTIVNLRLSHNTTQGSAMHTKPLSKPKHTILLGLILAESTRIHGKHKGRTSRALHSTPKLQQSKHTRATSQASSHAHTVAQTIIKRSELLEPLSLTHELRTTVRRQHAFGHIQPRLGHTQGSITHIIKAR